MGLRVVVRDATGTVVAALAKTFPCISESEVAEVLGA